MPRTQFAYSATLEWALVAHWWGVGWDAWEEISTEQQAHMIAVYRASNQIEAVASHYSRPRGKGRQPGYQG